MLPMIASLSCRCAYRCHAAALFRRLDIFRHAMPAFRHAYISLMFSATLTLLAITMFRQYACLPLML